MEHREWPFKLEKNTVLRQPPKWLELKEGGFITVYLDNIIVIASDGTIEKMFGLFKPETEGGSNVFKRCFNVDLKEWEHRTSTMWETNPIEFLGVEIHRRSASHAKYHTRWRASPSRAAKWKLTAEQMWLRMVNDQATFRDVAKLTGRALWCHSLSLEPLCELHDIINVLRRSAKARQNQRWEGRHMLTTQEKDICKATLDRLFDNEWLTDKRWDSKPPRKVWACSDASGSAWGYVTWGHQDTIVGAPFPKQICEAHIFVKEFLAAEYCIMNILESAVSNTPGKQHYTHIVLGIDNSAVAQVLRNMYSANTFVQPRISALNKALREAETTLEIVNVRSEDNAADEPSRGTTPTEEKKRLTREVLRLGTQGLRANEYNPGDAPTKTWIRRNDENEVDEFDTIEALGAAFACDDEQDIAGAH
jgi:hypothetical protein